MWVVETGQFSDRSSHTWSEGLYCTTLAVHFSWVTIIILGRGYTVLGIVFGQYYWLYAVFSTKINISHFTQIFRHLLLGRCSQHQRNIFCPPHPSPLPPPYILSVNVCMTLALSVITLNRVANKTNRTTLLDLSASLLAGGAAGFHQILPGSGQQLLTKVSKHELQYLSAAHPFKLDCVQFQ